MQCDQWVNAIHVELDNLRSHGAFHLVPRSEPLKKGKRIMRLTFVFKIKVHADRSLDKFKARLCVVGTGQVQGEDYWESYSSTARTTSVKLVVILTTVEDWIDFHFDLHGAFLTADIDADVYTDQPAGIEPETGPNGEPMCWKLDKAIYGTVQAARLFTSKFKQFLLSIGFEQSFDDDNVFRLNHQLGRIILATHVDDGIGGASTQQVLQWFYGKIEASEFSFSVPPGPWRTVLGFGLRRDRAARTVTLSAERHISDLADEHLSDEARPLTPQLPSTKDIMSLAPPPSETPQEEALLEPMRKRARSLKGGLIYIAQVHPAIAHPIARICALMAKPTHASYAAAKLVLWWLWAHRDLGVTWGGPDIRSVHDLVPRGSPRQPTDPQRDGSLCCFVDSDLARQTMPAATVEDIERAPPDKNASRSQLGYVVHFAHGTLDGISRRQHSTAVDTPAAELFAASVASAQLLHLTGVLRFVSFGVLGHDVVPVWCDNSVTVLVSTDSTPLKRLAYIARRVRLLQELARHGIVKLHDVPGTQNPADIFTKHLTREEFERYMTIVYNCSAEQLSAVKPGRPRSKATRSGGGVTA